MNFFLNFIISLVKKVYFICFMLNGSWEDGKNFRVGILLSKILLG